MLAYWGRRGALADFTFELAEEILVSHPATIAISRSNEKYDDFLKFGEALFATQTFDSVLGAAVSLGNAFRLRRALIDRIVRDRTRVLIDLMPHIWSPIITPVVRKLGVRHVIVVHDSDAHPGDLTGLLTNRWLLGEAYRSDHIITLSNFVQQRLIADRGIPQAKITPLFHPDLTFKRTKSTSSQSDGILRILFFGRLLPYKGLDLFLDALDILRARGIRVEAGVFGSGDIGAHAARLTQLGVYVENRWLRSDEIRQRLEQYDVFAACHSEASQSGVVAAALGAGMPVIAVPVGGIPEQVTPEVTGIVVSDRTPSAFADAIARIIHEPELLEKLRMGVQRSMPTRSMRRFASEVLDIVQNQTKNGSNAQQGPHETSSQPARDAKDPPQ